MNGPHTLLLASAGAGKTYCLARRFAALVLAGVEPDRILATTFTRKASGEILDRVLMRLRDAAAPDDAKGRAELDGEIAALFGARPPLTADACGEVLARVVRRIDRFQVRTIDAFFLRLVGVFQAELELAPEWAITSEIEERAHRREVIARLLESLEPEERIELLRGIASGKATAGAEFALVGAVEGAEEVGRAVEPGAWDGVRPHELPAGLDFARTIQTVRSAKPAKSDKGKENGHWKNALAKLRAMIEDVESPIDVPTSVWSHGLVKAAPISESRTYYKLEIEPALCDALVELADCATVGATEDLRARNRAIASFLARYLPMDDSMRRETGAYRYADFTRALADGPAGTGASEWLIDLAYRLDGRIDHILLDEFQDTAPLQWRLLHPLASEVLATGEGRSFFCVGDVKQSIYGWRGAEPRLLAEMADREPALDAETLSMNWRSSPVVLSTVDRVFETIADRGCLAGDERDVPRAATEDWMSRYQPHVGAREELAGAARLWRARAEDKNAGEGKLDPALLLAVERVARLREEHPDASIAVLVRAKKAIARIRFLLSRRGIEASDEGGNPLTDAVSVRWILALLQLADHPSDGYARMQVALSPFGAEFGLDPSAVHADESQAIAREVASRIRADLAHAGYGSFVAERVHRLEGAVTPWDARRLEQLVDLAMRHDTRPTLRPIDFVELVREERVPDPSAASVLVMTVHASKGLEFDIVVLPELGKDISLRLDTYVAPVDDVVEAPTLATVAPKKELAARHPQLGAILAGEERRKMTDVLSALYVAMTRAVHGLELIVPASATGDDAEALRTSNLVAPALMSSDGPVRPADDEGETETDRADLLWQHEDSDDAWVPTAPDVDEATPVAEARLELVADGAEPDDVIRPSAHDAPVPGLDDVFGEGNRAALRLGDAVHSLFEGVEWIDEHDRTDDDLRRECRMRFGDGPHVDDAVAAFGRAVAAHDVRTALTRSSDDLEVHRERTVDVETPGGRVFGIIDRLVLTRRDGAVVGAQVIDFKTDASRTDDELREAYSAQLEAYRAAVQAMFDLAPERVGAALVVAPLAGDARVVALG